MAIARRFVLTTASRAKNHRTEVTDLRSRRRGYARGRICWRLARDRRVVDELWRRPADTAVRR